MRLKNRLFETTEVLFTPKFIVYELHYANVEKKIVIGNSLQIKNEKFVILIFLFKLTPKVLHLYGCHFEMILILSGLDVILKQLRDGKMCGSNSFRDGC